GRAPPPTRALPATGERRPGPAVDWVEPYPPAGHRLPPPFRGPFPEEERGAARARRSHRSPPKAPAARAPGDAAGAGPRDSLTSAVTGAHRPASAAEP